MATWLDEILYSEYLGLKATDLMVIPFGNTAARPTGGDLLDGQLYINTDIYADPVVEWNIGGTWYQPDIDTNFAISDLTLTGNRKHTIGTYKMELVKNPTATSHFTVDFTPAAEKVISQILIGADATVVRWDETEFLVSSVDGTYATEFEVSATTGTYGEYAFNVAGFNFKSSFAINDIGAGMYMDSEMSAGSGTYIHNIFAANETSTKMGFYDDVGGSPSFAGYRVSSTNQALYMDGLTSTTAGTKKMLIVDPLFDNRVYYMDIPTGGGGGGESLMDTLVIGNVVDAADPDGKIIFDYSGNTIIEMREDSGSGIVFVNNSAGLQTIVLTGNGGTIEANSLTGADVRTLTTTGAGVIQAAANGADGTVWTMVSGLPAWATGTTDTGSPIYVVAASDAPALIKSRADYVCDGTADQVEINTALALGSVQLTQGTFYIAASITPPSNRQLIGSGPETVLVNQGLTGGFVASTSANTMIRGTTLSNVSIKSMTLNGDAATDAGYGIYFSTVGSGEGATAVNGVRVENVYFTKFTKTGVQFDFCINNVITGCQFVDVRNDAITMGRTSGSNKTKNTLISNNIFNGSLAAVFVTFAEKITIEGNYAIEQTDITLQIENANDIVIRNNTIKGHKHNAVYFTTVTSGLIDGNYIYDSTGTGSDAAIALYDSPYVIISNNRIDDTPEQGIFADTCSNLVIANNTVSNCNTANGGYSAIESSSNTGAFIVGNTVYKGTTNLQVYGIRIANDTNTIVTGNNLYTAGVTGDIQLAGATTGTKLRDNIANSGAWRDLLITAAQYEMSTARLLGRTTASQGAIEEITVSTGLSLAAGVLTSTITQYTDEMAQDAIGAMINSSDFTYTDATPELRWNGLNVRKNSAGSVFTRRRLNFIEGTNVTLTVADDGTDGEVDITIAATGGGGGSGTVTDFIFTDGNGFDGTVTTSTATPTLSLTTTVTDNHVMVSNSGAISGSTGLMYDGSTLTVVNDINIGANIINNSANFVLAGYGGSGLYAYTNDVGRYFTIAPNFVSIAQFRSTGTYLYEISAPSTPAAGTGALYPKSDGLLYWKNDSGTEYDLTATGAGGSGITRTVVVTSGSVTVGSTASTDYIYYVAGAHTISFPAAAGNTNRYTIKNNHSAAITIDTVGAETIDGTASITVAASDSVDMGSDGTNWFVL